ncbi:MAG: hypothetical protein DI555_06400 [Novosphingobium pentaromativorans]|uniref:Uncharacterized protein n=1 Tax=Novosphingobium pentaromativorans TaxID=205844 RepID=A0A2W5QXW3_9SPHN|nr:MAG: hypothetical protein DI555_06400 [Novosphingobium pentaromativorans]
MKPQPFTIIEPQIERLVDGCLSRLYRPVGRLKAIRPGDLLWVREPFHLPREFEHKSPVQAELRGARPTFVTDILTPEPEPTLGRRRFARELLRVWHRHHLQVAYVGRAALQSITIDEILAQGFTHRAAFARAWDKNLALSNGDQVWKNNPEVLVIDFHHIARPLPATPPAIALAPRNSATLETRA